MSAVVTDEDGMGSKMVTGPRRGEVSDEGQEGWLVGCRVGQLQVHSVTGLKKSLHMVVVKLRVTLVNFVRHTEVFWSFLKY